ncbi:hypothetical protein MKZ38_003784 [Zalerion maritima]|uniref:Cyclin-dependent kinase n=1 Tax=Zalerion maritima TaxID=339359 RepID=A0AAD5RMH0_9PEZI|nr:hypothetical protein MKZ38_003784 [Zalerion maritima]
MHHAAANATATSGPSPNAAVLHHHDSQQAPVLPPLHPVSSSITTTPAPTTNTAAAISAVRYESTSQPQSRSHQHHYSVDSLPRSSLPHGSSAVSHLVPGATINTDSSFSQPVLPSSQDTIPDTAYTTPVASQDPDIASSGLQGSSQMLQHLSQIAATQEKMADPQSPVGGASRKRMADGAVKTTRDRSSTSPVYPMSAGMTGPPGRGGHSRNTSTVSMASTASSKLGELSSELKTRLSYAMVKVNHGWQARSIDEVENLASQAVSPTSTNSTLHGRHGSSASPRMRLASSQPLPQNAHFDANWRSYSRTQSSASPPASHLGAPTALAPPAPIHASRPPQNTRKNSRTKYPHAQLSHSHHASPSGTPHTPGQPSPLQTTPAQRGIQTPVVDPILFSPHQNAREQETIEALLSMGSPNNAGNIVHNFSPQMGPPSRSQQSQGHQRTALPSSRLSQSQEATISPARKSLPSGRPRQNGKRVGFEKLSSNASEMDIDDSYASPRGAGSRGTPRRKLNGQPLRPLPMSSGLSGPSRPRQKLADEDIERMLDRAGAGDSSDSESEIQIPVRATRTGRIGA